MVVDSHVDVVRVNIKSDSVDRGVNIQNLAGQCEIVRCHVRIIGGALGHDDEGLGSDFASQEAERGLLVRNGQVRRPVGNSDGGLEVFNYLAHFGRVIEVNVA